MRENGKESKRFIEHMTKLFSLAAIEKGSLEEHILKNLCTIPLDRFEGLAVQLGADDKQSIVDAAECFAVHMSSSLLLMRIIPIYSSIITTFYPVVKENICRGRGARRKTSTTMKNKTFVSAPWDRRCKG